MLRLNTFLNCKKKYLDLNLTFNPPSTIHSTMHQIKAAILSMSSNLTFKLLFEKKTSSKSILI